MASGPLTSWQKDGEEIEVLTDFIFLGFKITADGDCSQEIKRRLLLGRKVMANLDSILKSRGITLPTKVCIVKAMVFPVAMYGCESWTIRKAERQRIEAFELWCWRRLLRVPWTARRSNRSVLEEINPDCSLEGQIVMLGDYGSAPWQLCHGILQGSILSPLLFNIYMKLLGEVIRRCGLRNHQYADDTQLYLSFSTNPGEAVAVLNRCLAEVMGWMRANKLKLSPGKTEVLLVGGSGFGEGDLDLVLNGVALPLMDKVCSLGVLLNPELSLEAQVTAVARSTFFQLRLVYQLRPYLENDCLVTVTHALVTSRLDFCNTLYVGLPLKTIRILQLVQNRAARLLTGTGHYVHMTPVLRQLHWLPIEVRVQFKVLFMTYKALNGLGPGYLNGLGPGLCSYVPARPLRSAGESLLRKPSVKDIRRVSTRRRAFSAVAPNLWNALPREVHLSLSLFVFRRQAKTFLFKRHFNC
uniref:Reverse transcriptase domain-containing protein n=1 Tax=Varanus komodoensis TaxID=61221 RepID=A0A8D2L5S4_VARKO